MRRMPATIPLGEIVGAVSELGGHYPGGEVGRFHAGLNFLERKHFVILSGLSGTGKTVLALAYARAVHGVPDMRAPDPFLSVCPVRPEWTDPTGLTGYYHVLSNRYVVPPFLEAVMLATAHEDSPVFVVLDEMNLARVEYHLSDVLSCIETGQPLQRRIARVWPTASGRASRREHGVPTDGHGWARMGTDGRRCWTCSASISPTCPRFDRGTQHRAQTAALSRTAGLHRC